MITFRQICPWAMTDQHGYRIRLSHYGLFPHGVTAGMDLLATDTAGSQFIRMTWLGDSGDMLPCFVLNDGKEQVK